MTANQVALWYLVASVFFTLALKGLSSPETSRRGNLYGMNGMAIAVVTTLAIVAKGQTAAGDAGPTGFGTAATGSGLAGEGGSAVVTTLPVSRAGDSETAGRGTEVSGFVETAAGSGLAEDDAMPAGLTGACTSMVS